LLAALLLMMTYFLNDALEFSVSLKKYKASETKQKNNNLTQQPVNPDTNENTIETCYEDDGLMDDYQYALNVCIQGNMCAKGQYTEWLKVKTILKNEYLLCRLMCMYCSWFHQPQSWGSGCTG
jgi:hypothetical protein